MIKNLDNMLNAVEGKAQPAKETIKLKPSKTLSYFDMDKNEPNQAMVIEYFELKKQDTKIAKRMKELRPQVEKMLQVNQCFRSVETGYEIVKELGKAVKRVDYKGAIEFVCKKHNEDPIAIIKQFTPDDKLIERVRIRKASKLVR